MTFEAAASSSVAVEREVDVLRIRCYALIHVLLKSSLNLLTKEVKHTAPSRYISKCVIICPNIRVWALDTPKAPKKSEGDGEKPG